MRITELTREQVKEIYHEHMVCDFEANERKPLAMIMKAIDDDAYDCLGLLEEEKILGYAFFIRRGKDYLLDYFAIVRFYRNMGLGSTFLQKIADYYQEADSLICEVENPAYAHKEEDHILQERRCSFYFRNGFYDTEVEVKTFGVEYRILELQLGKGLHTTEQIRVLYQDHYKSFLPKVIYKTMIRMR